MDWLIDYSSQKVNEGGPSSNEV